MSSTATPEPGTDPTAVTDLDPVGTTSQVEAVETPDPDDDALIWLTLPDAAEVSGVALQVLRRWLRDGDLIAARRGERRVLSIPASFLLDGAPVPTLKGTITVLRDSGFDDEAAIRWLSTPDETIPGTPIEALRQGRKTEIRRRAQAAGF